MLEISILKIYLDVNECKSYLSTQNKHINTREYNLIEELISSVKNYNREKFHESINNFDSIAPLEIWEKELLSNLKENI